MFSNLSFLVNIISHVKDFAMIGGAILSVCGVGFAAFKFFAKNSNPVTAITGNIRLILEVCAVVVVLAIGGIFYVNHQKEVAAFVSAQQTITNDTNIIASKDTALDMQGKTVKELQDDIAKINTINQQLQTQTIQDQQNLNDLKTKIKKPIILKTPQDVLQYQNEVNTMSDDSNDCFKNLSVKNEKNSFCSTSN